MSEILGPYSEADFKVMTMLRKNLAFYKQNPTKHSVLIEKETDLYNMFKNKEVA